MIGKLSLLVAATMLTQTFPAHAAQDTLHRTAQEVVGQGATGVQIRSIRDGRVRTAAAGVADLVTHGPVSTEGRFRIGSTTKPFVSTVVLQLVAEHRIRLDDPVEHHLPGLLPEGKKITVRMLLQHTSGLYEYLRGEPLASEDFAKFRFKHFDAEDLVALATVQPLDFRPGTAYSFSNTNYIVLGMLIERITGRPWGAEVTERIFLPLKMDHSSAPGDRIRIPGKHARGYLPSGQSLVDVTEMNPTMAGSAGALISTTADLDKFFRALASGRLLPRVLLAEMTRPLPFTNGYALGLETRRTPCGVTVIGHTGGIPGYATVAFTSLDGKHRVLASLTLGHGPGNDAVHALIDKAICA
ncbi:serine hydrolase domain-containing protein [Amycolatopsis sp. NPDC051071]|uniref:serine hydrolase domain-containing protein n=1 Tax=Amycolatopsis sp. NPDC051071 TaxID=3154637 RepID=UPI00343A57C0